MKTCGMDVIIYLNVLEEEHVNGEASEIKSFVYLYQKVIIGFHVLGF